MKSLWFDAVGFFVFLFIHPGRFSRRMTIICYRNALCISYLCYTATHTLYMGEWVMNYTLMHKNFPVVLIEIDRETGVVSKVGKSFASERVPVGVSVRDGLPNRGDLNDWWQGRSIPASRQNIRQALKTLGVSSTDKLLTQCYGLSL